MATFAMSKRFLSHLNRITFKQQRRLGRVSLGLARVVVELAVEV